MTQSENRRTLPQQETKADTPDTIEKKIPANKKYNPPTFALQFLRSTMFSLFLFSVSLFVLYILGNYQNFLDKNILFIMKSLQITSSFSAVIAILLIILHLIVYFKTKKRFYLKINISAFFVFLVSMVLMVSVNFLIIISKL